MELAKSETLYVYVGGQGGSNQTITNTGGYNGGGASGNNNGGYSMGGGGATDFRLVNGTWNDATSLRSRIMIAAGGGGNVYASGYTVTTGYGGALVGGSGGGTFSDVDPTGGTQISGGVGRDSPSRDGVFGYAPQSNISGWGGGGGGGHYGGATGHGKGGSGGSSYISGYTGCVAVTSASDTTPKSGCTDGTTDVACSYHYSGKIFKDTRMIAGNALMSSKDATGTMIGNSGNGYAKVTPVVPTIYAPNLVVIQGNELDINAISCVDNGSGCEIISMPHKDTSLLLPGEHTLKIVVKDDLGATYQYFKTLTVLDNTELTSIAEVHPGSYVKYIGNNGCSGASCSGQNANYVDDNNMGYCHSNWSATNSVIVPYNSNKWRVAYVSGSKAYLISGGATDCVATTTSGAISNVPITTSDYETTSGLPLHITNLKSTASKYCNVAFVDGGTCNDNAVWPMGGSDFTQITGSELSNASCFNLHYNTSCGYQNPLIDINGYYWINYLASSNTHLFIFERTPGRVSNDTPKDSLGVRPVIPLSSSVIVVGGTGTYEDPYLIDNPNTIKDLSGNMNNGTLMGSLKWNKEAGTVSTSNSKWIHAGLVNYNFGSDVSFVIRMKYNALSSSTGVAQETFGNWEAGGFGIQLSTSNYIYYNAYINGTYVGITSSSAITANTWYTIVGTYDGSQLLLYFDGTQVASTAATGSIGLSKAPFGIGGNPSATSDGITGSTKAEYSDVLIFDRALSAEEVATYYSGEVNVVNKQDLILHYDFKR